MKTLNVLKLYPGIDITFYETMPECVKVLREGSVEALLNNSYVWSYVLQKPSYEDLEVQPEALITMDFKVGTLDTPEGRKILDRLNEGIASITDSRRQAIVLDYTTRRLYRYDFYDYVYQYGLIILFIVLLLVLLVILNIQMRRSLLRKHEEKMRQLIDHDPLTGLLSLNGFRKKVGKILRSYPETPYFLSYNNIKNFKFINYSMGMKAGDDLLKFWAARSLENLSGEKEAICRIDGDHFAVLRIVVGEENMRNDELNVLNPVRDFFVNQGKETQVQLCSGIYVLTPEDYLNTDVDHMLDYARMAERKVRDTKKDGFEFYNPHEWERGKRTADVVGHLPMAIQSGELHVWYQPQVNYATREMTGAEALCRWNHPKLGWIRPADFIPTLEDAKLIYDLDCFVWETVCRDLQRWNEQGKHRTISVNVSRGDIREERNIPGHFYDLIQKYSLTPDQLRIEITETAYAEDPELLIRTTVQLREFGFQVEMDDFGSGYSSLHMLKEVPVDRIKLDLHFLSGTGDPERGRIIISYIIQMADSLRMNLIAEGVENVTQAEFLRSRGCMEMQGFYFYKPMSVEEFERLGDSIRVIASEEG